MLPLARAVPASIVLKLPEIVPDISINVPVLYGIFSIGLALVLGVGAAIIRKFISESRKKYKQAIKS